MAGRPPAGRCQVPDASFLRRRAAVACALVAVAAGCGQEWTPQWPAAPPLAAALADALGPGRFTEPRLTLARRHAPCAETGDDGLIPRIACDSVPPPGSAAHLAALELAAEAQARLRAGDDADALHVAGLLGLLWPDAAGNGLDRSISLLQEASLSPKPDASVLSDLAAAHLLRAEYHDSPGDLLLALEAGGRALARDPWHRPALFNRALTLERLELTDRAAQAWAAYLGVDSTTAWAAEARERAARLRRVPERVDWDAETPPRPDGVSRLEAAAERDPQGARLFAMDRALPAWGRSLLAGRASEAEAWLVAAEHIGRALARRSGDATVAESVRRIRAMPGARARRRLGEAFRLYGAARERYRAADYGRARDLFDAADAA